MIHRVFSTLSTFKELTLHPGLNILLADRAPTATERQTRNGSGKTSFIELVHFVLGADCPPKSLFRSQPLVSSDFGIEFDLAGQTTRARRSGSAPSRVFLDRYDASQWLLTPSIARNTGQAFLSTSAWREVLGGIFFRLGTAGASSDGERFLPSFRSLFSYFARRELSGGFLRPFKHSELQQLWNQQVCLCFLLGVDATIPQQLQTVREREKALAELRKAGAQGTLGPAIGSVAELRTQLAVQEGQSNELRQRVDSFEVLPQYRELEAEASGLARQIGTLADGNTIDLRFINELQAALADEAAPSEQDLQALYSEIGLILPDRVLRRFNEVRAFHESVIANRRLYLSGELAAAQARLDNREREKQAADERRRQIMAILHSGGALDQFLALQREVSRIEAGTEIVRQRLVTAEHIEGTRAQLDIERNHLFLRMQQDFHEQREQLNAAIRAFQNASNALYDEAGSLVIDAGDNGPTFDVNIHGAQSRGISNMQVFCFDMMLMRLCASQGIGPGFLIHDSHLFDGVDTRQTARALQVGAETANELGFQYIVTMNSDLMPRDFPDNFSVEPYVLPVRLTDATDDGRLFGIRFETTPTSPQSEREPR